MIYDTLANVLRQCLFWVFLCSSAIVPVRWQITLQFSRLHAQIHGVAKFQQVKKERLVNAFSFMSADPP